MIVKKLDLSSLSSVRSFAEDINKTEGKLDVLIHNAGVAYTFEKVVTKDGLDMTMATNHFGPFLLTHLLIGIMHSTFTYENFELIDIFFKKSFLEFQIC